MRNLFIVFLLTILSCAPFIYNKTTDDSKNEPKVIQGDIVIRKAMTLIAKEEGLTLNPQYGELGYYSKFCYMKHKGQSITKSQADLCLKEHVMNIYLQLATLFAKNDIYLNENQYAALISLCYNIKGNVNAFAKSKLFQAIKNKNAEGIYAEMVSDGWIKGEFMQGLLERRQREYNMFIGK